ncbi:MAG: hypothetical protein Q8M29_06735 [Bacteroidota bacterium]|nr:hypothetical protein [Bacteroidota bacterium]
MKKKKITLGIILIVIGSGIAIQATLTIITPIKSLMNDQNNSSVGFYLGSIVAAVLLWFLVFALIIGGIKLIKSTRKKKSTYVSPFDKFK